MLSKNIAIMVLNAALSSGGDYAEIYIEETKSLNLVYQENKVDGITRSHLYGAGIRILLGTSSVYGYTNDVSRKGLLKLAENLAARYSEERKITVAAIKKGKVPTVNRIEDHLDEAPLEEKIAMLRSGSDAAFATDPRIINVRAGWYESRKTIALYVAEGETAYFYPTEEERGRFSVFATARDGDKVEGGSEAPGMSQGWNYFKTNIDPKAIGEKAAKQAITLLSARECPSGRFAVVIGNGWGGVLFHEACGHPLEASATSRHLSVFSDSIGEQIASPIVSAVDDGTLPGEWGSNNIDTEGVETKRNMLIKDGICVGFLVDRLSGRRIGMEPNGTSRRQSYAYEPTSRMNNTYILPGKDKKEDIIADTKLGIYVTGFNGGSVNPTTGEFNFTASEAYAIRDGKIAEPLKGCTLIGSGKEILMNIDRVGDDLNLGQGNCGAASGSIPVNVGQPTIRLSSITVGGRGGETL